MNVILAIISLFLVLWATGGTLPKEHNFRMLLYVAAIILFLLAVYYD